MNRISHNINYEIVEPLINPVIQSTSIDKWGVDRPNPVLRKTLSAAILAGSFFMDSYPIAPPETITYDKWQQPINQPYFAKTMIVGTGLKVNAKFNTPEISNGFYRSITFDQPASDLTDFTVVIKGTATYLKTKSNGGKVNNSNGYDIIFYSNSSLTTKLKFERVVWDGSTGNFEFWVKIPTLTSASATVIYLAYGNTSVITDQQDINNTWNSGYKGVWHLKEGASVVPVTDGTFRSTTITGTAISATAAAWDNSVRGEPGNVLYDPGNAIGGNYLFFFTGYAGSYTQGQTFLGIAYSTDGVSWTKYASNPITLPSNVYIEDPYCIKIGSTYYLYGEDAPNVNIKLFTSTDLINWTAQGTVLAPGSGWDSVWIGSPTVFKEGSTWFMLYEGNTSNGQIGLATSSDGITWTRESTNPVFIGTDAAWVLSGGAVCADDVYKSGSTYYMLYHGEASSNVFKTGLATSTDLINWTDKSFNPIANSVTVMYLDAVNGKFIQAGATGASESAFYLSNGTAISLPDSTSNANNAANTLATSTSSGKVGGAMDFNGTNAFLDCGNGSSLNITSSFTHSCWLKLGAQPANGVWFRVFDKSGTGTLGAFSGYATVGGVGSLGLFYGAAGQSFVSNALTTGVWYHIAFTHDDANNEDKIYVNGSSISTVTGRTDNPGSQGQSFYLMCEAGSTKFTNGTLDEPRVSNAVRNADWIATEYSNQNDPDNFYSIGSETPA